jgi:hypothetical protein
LARDGLAASSLPSSRPYAESETAHAATASGTTTRKKYEEYEGKNTKPNWFLCVLLRVRRALRAPRAEAVGPGSASRKDGSRLPTLTGEGPGEGFGTSASHVGDIDGDGHDDLAVGAWQYAREAISGGRIYLPQSVWFGRPLDERLVNEAIRIAEAGIR